MPYSDLSDAWNSYDPRYNRVSQQVFPTNEGEGESPPQPDQRRLNAFLQWRNADMREAAPPLDAPQIQGPTRPGFNDPAVLARAYGDIQRDLRLNPDQALGFLSNLNAESFGFAKPQEEGPQIRGANTGGLGWGQWTAGRRAAFEDYLRQTGAPPTSYEGNYGFLTTELQDPKWQPFLENLRRQRDAESATRYTEKGYENPSRITGRQDWLARTRRELPASAIALGQVRGSAPPAANSLETARPYTSLPPNYLRPQPFATGSSELYRENLLF